MIGAPDPGVIDDDVVAVDLEVGSGASHSGSAHAEIEIVERNRIFNVTHVAALKTDLGRTNLNQHGRTRLSGVNKKARDDDAVLVIGDKGGVAIDGAQRGEAKSHNHRAGTGDTDGLSKLVNAGGEEQVFAGCQLCIDGGGGVAGVGDVEAIDGD